MSWAFYGLCYVHSLIQYSNAPLEVAGVILSLHRRWSLGNSRTNSDPTRSITLIQELGNSSFPCGVAVQKAHETECTKGAPWSYIWGRLYSNWKRCMYPNVRCSTSHNSQDMEATYMSIKRWREKEDMIHTHNGIWLLLLLSHVWLFCDTVVCSPPDSCPWDFPRKEYLSGLPFPPPGDLSNPGIEPMSPTWAGRFFPLSHQGSNNAMFSSVQFSSVAQSCLTPCDPMNRSTQASLSITNSWSLPKLMSIE